MAVYKTVTKPSSTLPADIPYSAMIMLITALSFLFVSRLARKHFQDDDVNG